MSTGYCHIVTDTGQWTKEKQGLTKSDMITLWIYSISFTKDDAGIDFFSNDCSAIYAQRAG